MTALIAAESIVLTIVVVLVAGLLRSHAEILARLRVADDGGPGPDTVNAVEQGLQVHRSSAKTASFIAGVTLGGEPQTLDLETSREARVLAFLSSGCLACEGFWSAFSESDAERELGVPISVITKGPDNESVVRLRKLAKGSVSPLMSDNAWSVFDVPVSPFFLYVLPGGHIYGGGAADSWPKLVALVNEAREHDSLVATGSLAAGPT